MKNTFILLTFILSGCSASRITSSWKNAAASPQNYSPVMVVGITNAEDSSLCRVMEQRFADELNKLGYRALSSIAVYGPGAYKDLQEEEIFKLVYKRGINAIITFELLDKEKVVYPQPLWLNHDLSWSHYSTIPVPVYDRIHYSVQTNYLWESNLYDMNGFLLLYSVQSISYEPGSNKNLSREYARLVLDDMTKKGVLQKQVILLKAF